MIALGVDRARASRCWLVSLLSTNFERLIHLLKAAPGVGFYPTSKHRHKLAGEDLTLLKPYKKSSKWFYAENMFTIKIPGIRKSPNQQSSRFGSALSTFGRKVIPHAPEGC